jgi:O-antigen/teichoic acid export membrane protein
VHDHQSRIAFFLLLSAITNITLNLLLIPLLGANGAALARVASVFLLFVLSYVTVYRQVMAVTLAPLLARSTLATIVMVAVLWPIRQWPVGLLVGVGALVYGIAVLGVGAISRDELRLLLRAWRRKELSTDVKPHNQV